MTGAGNDAYRFDDRAGGAWTPSDETRWKNPDYTVSNARAAGLKATGLQRCDIHTVRISTSAAANTQNLVDKIYFEDADEAMIAVILDDADWVFTQQQAYAIPGSTLITPISGRLTRADEAPFAAAQRIAATKLGIKDTPGNTAPRVLDAYGLADGSIPTTYDGNLQWSFLGRYRNLADSGGGFTFAYLLRASRDNLGSDVLLPNDPPPEPPTRHLGSNDDEPSVLFAMPTSTLRQALLRGAFQETRGAATIAMAMLHVEQQLRQL